MDHDGKLTKEEFAVAMYLIRGKLEGKEIPNELPHSLIPPANLSELVEQMNASVSTVSLPIANVATAERAHTPPPPYIEDLHIGSEDGA